jgi:hypothetical protein
MGKNGDRLRIGYKWVKMDIGQCTKSKNITITPEILKLIAEIDEFKGRWTGIETLAPERMTSLRRNAPIEAIGRLSEQRPFAQGLFHIERLDSLRRGPGSFLDG